MNAEKNFDVRLKQYSGIASQTINPITIPKDFDSAEFKNDDLRDSFI